MRTSPVSSLTAGQRPALWQLLAGTLLLTATASTLAADAPDPATTAAAARIAVTVCGACHGPAGNSLQPKFPRLAAQRASYLGAQLKAFRSQSRGDPDAIGYMWGMASELDDTMVDALASYYSTQAATASGGGGDAALIARGREIYERGVPDQGVPQCAACHGPDARGQEDFPRLAGQHAQYILKQLASFQSNMRNVATMHGVAQNLRVPEMRAVAAFLNSLP